MTIKAQTELDEFLDSFDGLRDRMNRELDTWPPPTTEILALWREAKRRFHDNGKTD